MEKIRNLLNQVGIINKKNNEILDATGGRFNMFRLCGVNHYENTHSAIIAEFLNPNGTHGLKSKFLDCFIQTIKECITQTSDEDFKFIDFNCQKAQVHTEYSTEEGRMDILLEDNKNKVIIIENKIYAGDQDKQLQRYEGYVQNRTKEYQILYLTLFGNKASKQSGEGVNYSPISYKDNIIDWLEKCVAIASRFPIVRETLIQYINHLKQLTNQDMNIKNQEEIAEFISKIDNLRAARTVFQNYPLVFKYIIENRFNPKMIEFAKDNGLEYKYVKCEECFVRFELTNSNWQGKYKIAFTFEKGQFHYGILNYLDKYKIPENKRRFIHAELKKAGVHNGKEDNWWAFYAQIPHLNLKAWEDDIIGSDNFLLNCQEKIDLLLKAIEGMEL